MKAQDGGTSGDSEMMELSTDVAYKGKPLAYKEKMLTMECKRDKMLE